MSGTHSRSVSGLLQDLRAGNHAAFDELLPLVYEELHQVAARQRRHWSGDETLDTTALVHEAYLRLVDQSAPDWRSRAHFLAVAATAMRRILIDYAKRRRAAKRGGGARHYSLDQLEAALRGTETSGAADEALCTLDEALGRLQQGNPRHSRIVECRFFGGMSIEDTAEALGISPATVKRGWAMAQAWLTAISRRRRRMRHDRARTGATVVHRPRSGGGAVRAGQGPRARGPRWISGGGVPR